MKSAMRAVGCCADSGCNTLRLRFAKLARIILMQVFKQVASRT